MLLISLLFLFSCSSKQNEDANYSIIKQQIQELVYQSNKAPTEIAGLQLVLIKDGEVAFEHAEGFASITPSGDKLPLTINHKVRIASISKLILTMSLMTLVEDGLVDLDQDISTYLGFSVRNPEYPDIKITTRQVLAHVSSIRDNGQYFLPYGENYQQFFTVNQMTGGGHFATEQNQAPGDYFMYSNLNFGLIAGVIEQVSGQRMDIFVQQALFEPLGLDISFNVCDFYQHQYRDLATLYRRGTGGEIWDPQGPWIPQVDGSEIACFYGGEKYSRMEIPDLSVLKDYQLGSNPTLFSPQGGLRASAKDLAILMKLFIGKNSSQVISKSTLAQMLEPVWTHDQQLNNGYTSGESPLDELNSTNKKTVYGLSTHIIDLKEWGLTDQSQTYYGHLGSAYGLLGQFWFDPKTGDGVIALITGLGDDPGKPASKTPLFAIEEAILTMSLRALNHL